MDDADLHLLRSLGADVETDPPPGLQARIEERLWQAILDEEAGRTSPRAIPGRRWFEGLLRPAVAAGAAATLAIGVAVTSDGGSGGTVTTPGQATVTQAGSGVLDATASSIFGTQGGSAAPISGTIDLTDTDGDERLIKGPAHDQRGNLDASSGEFANDAPRDPADLLEMVTDSLDDAGARDANDTTAFHVTMSWVVDPAVPTDLRAAMLRSLQGMSGIDDALTGRDIFGRDGIVVGHLDSSSGVRAQYLLDASSGTLLEARAFTTAYLDPACPPGTITQHVAFDEQGAAIDPSSARFVAWPSVVSACDPAA